MNLDSMVVILEIIYLKNKNGAYVINLDEYADVGTHWIALYVKDVMYKNTGILSPKSFF